MSNVDWDFAQKWVDDNRYKIKGYLYDHGLYNDMEDYLNYAYITAYDAVKKHKYANNIKYDAYFWQLFTQYCKRCIDDKMHKEATFTDLEIDDNDIPAPDEDEMMSFDLGISDISSILGIMTPAQSHVWQLLLFAIRPLSLQEIASSLHISPEAVRERMKGGLHRISKHNLIDQIRAKVA